MITMLTVLMMTATIIMISKKIHMFLESIQTQKNGWIMINENGDKEVRVFDCRCVCACAAVRRDKEGERRI